MKNSAHVGVVIGRFQVPDLHDGHHHLIRYAAGRHEKILILAGSRNSFPTPRNPLSFPIRRALILSHYPEAMVAEVMDHPSDAEWSRRVDNIVAALCPGMNAVLYGSRDSFIPYYQGSNETCEIPTITCKSGSDLRRRIKEEVAHTPDFRRGIIHAQMVRAPMPYPTVDIAVMKPDTNAVLLGQKPTDGGKYRFIGGFFDPELDTSLESAARRETYEETGGIETADYRYVGSRKVDDWRYRGSRDCIVTTLFRADYIFGAPRASDDITSLEWFDLSQIPHVLVPEHKPLGEMLITSLKTTKEQS